MFGDLIGLAVLGGVVFLAIRSLRKIKEKGGFCGNCQGCKGCH